MKAFSPDRQCTDSGERLSSYDGRANFAIIPTRLGCTETVNYPPGIKLVEIYSRVLSLSTNLGFELIW